MKFPSTILVEFWTGGYAPGMIIGQPVSEKWVNAFVKEVVKNGGSDERSFLMSYEDASEEFSECEIEDIEQYGLRIRMDPWIVGQYYGYDAQSIVD